MSIIEISHRVLKHDEYGLISVTNTTNIFEMKMDLCYIFNNLIVKSMDLEDLNNKIENIYVKSIFPSDYT